MRGRKLTSLLSVKKLMVAMTLGLILEQMIQVFELCPVVNTRCLQILLHMSSTLGIIHLAW